MRLTTFLLLLPLFVTAQCDIDRTARSYIAIPSFFSLYFQGQCIEGSIHDTTICVKFPPSGIGRVASFSYSSPSGQPAYVTGYTQYDESCTAIDYTPNVLPNTDTITVCYTIQAALIDNFCPYAIQANGLAVEFCGISATYEQNYVTTTFTTCSNAGTHYYAIQASQDALVWNTIATCQPQQITSSDASSYVIPAFYNVPGIAYLRVMELDYNGGASFSDIVTIDVPMVVSRNNVAFDIVGRRVPQGSKYAISR